MRSQGLQSLDGDDWGVGSHEPRRPRDRMVKTAVGFIVGNG